MKYKYTFLKNRLFYDEILIPYLDRMSKKGWNLVSVNSFFKFEKSSQVYKYQVDYNLLTDDYLETLDHLGYEHVCCMQDMHIYRDVNLDAEDLSSDEESKLESIEEKISSADLECRISILKNKLKNDIDKLSMNESNLEFKLNNDM